MYNLFMTGLVYPLAWYKVVKPEMARRRLQAHRSYPHLGVMVDPREVQELEPDYLGNRDLDGNHYALAVRRLGPARGLVGKVFKRPPGDSHALLPYGIVEGWQIDEDEGRACLDSLVPTGRLAEAAATALEMELGRVWRRIDGRSKQLLMTAHVLGRKVTGDDFRAYACAAYPLCGLAEYELQKRLKRGADARLKGNPPATIRYAYSRSVLVCQLPLVPDTSLAVEVLNDASALYPGDRIPEGFELKIHALSAVLTEESKPTLVDGWPLVNELHKVRRVRNRVAHAYFIEERHYSDLRKAVVHMLKLLYPDP
ncbi:MAG: hypothetical protein HY321_08105 [Armatimonadetes bacterium]|nr:hypothetical protein [Armatimonadota bacterium]